MEIKQRVLVTRAFRQLQEGVLKGLEIVDSLGCHDVPQDMTELLTHLEQLGEHVRKMEQAVMLHAGATAVLAVAREKKKAS